MSIPVALQPGTLPYTCYPDSPQQLNIDIVTRIVAMVFTQFAGVYSSPTAPPVDERDKIWYNTTNSRLYQWRAPAWQRQYDFPASSDVELIWKGSEADLRDFGLPAGGGAGGVGDSTGPLWEIDHELDGRTLVGPGAVPGTTPAVTIPEPDPTSIGGEYSHVLTVDELAKHKHNVSFPQANGTAADPAANRFLYTPKDNGGIGGSPNTDVSTWPQVVIGTEAGGDKGHNNMQPYIARYVIKRTARLWVPAPY